MPHKPKRPCSFPGCPSLVDGRYCPMHQKEINRQYNRYQRDPASRDRYGPEWRRIRERFLAVHPMCEICKGRGRLTPATEVHHKVKLADGGTNDEENLTALCRKCHSRISATVENRWGRESVPRMVYSTKISNFAEQSNAWEKMKIFDLYTSWDS